VAFQIELAKPFGELAGVLAPSFKELCGRLLFDGRESGKVFDSCEDAPDALRRGRLAIADSEKASKRKVRTPLS